MSRVRLLLASAGALAAIGFGAPAASAVVGVECPPDLFCITGGDSTNSAGKGNAAAARACQMIAPGRARGECVSAAARAMDSGKSR